MLKGRPSRRHATKQERIELYRVFRRIFCNSVPSIFFARALDVVQPNQDAFQNSRRHLVGRVGIQILP